MSHRPTKTALLIFSTGGWRDFAAAAASDFLNDQKVTKESPGVDVDELSRFSRGKRSALSAICPPDPHLRGTTRPGPVVKSGAGKI